MNIAILGFGTVGKGVYEIIKKNGLSHISVKKILKPRNVKEYDFDNVDNLYTSFDEILNDDSIDTVVECMGGLDPAFTYVKSLMEKGKNVVTSNKMLVATYFDELVSLSKKNKIYFLFEASVGGGIPWIENLSRLRTIDKVYGFKGILNGTTNFILDKMSNEGLEFERVLKNAKDLGYAENDPSFDIDGLDTFYKTIISANVASRASYEIKNNVVCGIRNIAKSDIDLFNKNGKVCKLIAEYNAVDNFLFVMPELFDKNLSIANVRENYNHIDVYTETEDMLSFEGQGAGKFPTAHSVIQDLERIDKNVAAPILTNEKKVSDIGKLMGEFYIKRRNGKVESTDEIYFTDIDLSDVVFIAKIN